MADELDNILGTMDIERQKDLLKDMLRSMWFTARMPGWEGARARTYLAQRGFDDLCPSCANCGRKNVSFRFGREGEYLCEDSKGCYEEVLYWAEKDTVVISVRTYPSNAVVGCWDARNLPASVTEYMAMNKPEIIARIPRETWNKDGDELLATLQEQVLRNNNEQPVTV